MKSCFSKSLQLILLTSLLALTGCYEGWDDTVSGDEENPEGGSPPFAYIFLELFRWADDAIDNTDCYSSGAEEYRKAEWKQRGEALSNALESITSKLVVEERFSGQVVNGTDCLASTPIDTAATRLAPWGSEDEKPTADEAERKIVHVKAVFWDDDVSGSPSDEVKAVDWLAWQRLQNEGLNVLSVHHFVLANESGGYLAAWDEAIAADAKNNGTPINQVNPTPAGISARSNVISDDTSAFIEWLGAQE